MGLFFRWSPGCFFSLFPSCLLDWVFGLGGSVVKALLFMEVSKLVGGKHLGFGAFRFASSVFGLDVYKIATSITISFRSLIVFSKLPD